MMNLVNPYGKINFIGNKSVGIKLLTLHFCYVKLIWISGFLHSYTIFLVIPPSTTKLAPVMKPELSDRR